MKDLLLLALAAVAVASPRFEAGLLDHSKYHRYSEIVNLMIGLQNSYPSAGVTHGKLDQQTAEGRDIAFLSITGGVGTNKKRIFIETGIHAREWIGPAAALYFGDRLLERRNLDSDASFLFNNFDWYIVPLANPDGYEFTHALEGDRLWRKNRRYMFVSECGSNVHGVDLNRNFDSDWSNAGASSSCNSETYHGPTVFSEPEATGIRDKVREIIRDNGAISAYIQLSAYGQELATPYTHTSTLPPNHQQQIAISNKARDAIHNATGETYSVASAGSLYHAAGTATDWAYMKENIPYSLSFALRPKVGDSNGFQLPPSEIIPTGIDVWAAMNAICREL